MIITVVDKDGPVKANIFVGQQGEIDKNLTSSAEDGRTPDFIVNTRSNQHLIVRVFSMGHIVHEGVYSPKLGCITIYLHPDPNLPGPEPKKNFLQRLFRL